MFCIPRTEGHTDTHENEYRGHPFSAIRPAKERLSPTDKGQFELGAKLWMHNKKSCLHVLVYVFNFVHIPLLFIAKAKNQTEKLHYQVSLRDLKVFR